jgi:Pectate lyase superfamily protein/Ca-dependent carbohydrate-binding module xylan-binding
MTDTSTAPTGTLDVKAYGAVGNGVTDDTAAIQAAATAASSQGKQLFFSPGTYAVSSSLQMPSNTTWTAAPNTATLVATAGNTLISSVLTQSDTLKGVTLSGGTSSPDTAAALLVGYKATGLTLSGDTVRDTNGIGVVLSDVNQTTVSNSNFTNIGNTADLANSHQGVAFSNDVAGYGNQNSVVNSAFSNIGLDAISATSQSGFSAVSNTVNTASINPGWGSQNAAAAGFYGINDTNLVVAGNDINHASGNGIDIAVSSQVEVYQNAVSGSGGAGIGLFSVTTGAASWNTTTDNNALNHFEFKGGIVLDANGQSNVTLAHNVSGNTGSTQTQLYGIQVVNGQDSNAGNLTVAQDNVLSGNQSSPISDTGSYDSVSDANLPALSYATPVNDAPTISGVAAAVSTSNNAATHPFQNANIVDPDFGVIDKLTVTTSGGSTNGILSGTGVSQTSTPGTYTIGATSGSTPSAMSTLLKGAVFTPTTNSAGTAVATTFTLHDTQSSPTSPTSATSSASTVVTATGGGNVSLLLSEDAYQGDAKYAVTVDGKQVINGASVTASHAAGQEQSLNLPGILTAGAHDIGISFLNDLYGGTSATDRNLYLSGIDVNNAPAAGVSPHTFFSDGTDHFSIVVPNS